MGKPDIVFDLGNVLLRCDLDRVSARLAAGSSLSSAEIRARLFRTEVIDPFDQGALEPDAFAGMVRKLCAWEGSVDELEAIWQDMLRPDEAMLELFTAVRARGHRTYLLSNINPFHVRYVSEAFPALLGADGWIFSCECALIKPDERIFRLLATRFGIDPGRSIFIDDRADNVDAARRLGFHGVVHVDARDTAARVEALIEVLSQGEMTEI